MYRGSSDVAAPYSVPATPLLVSAKSVTALIESFNVLALKV